MKKKFLLSVLIGILFLFGVGGDVFAGVGEDSVLVYPEKEDGYVTNWIKGSYGNSELLWDKAHDSIKGDRFNFTRHSIEAASGWSSDGYFFIHRSRLAFNFSGFDYSAVKDVILLKFLIELI